MTLLNRSSSLELVCLFLLALPACGGSAEVPPGGSGAPCPQGEICVPSTACSAGGSCTAQGGDGFPGYPDAGSPSAEDAGSLSAEDAAVPYPDGSVPPSWSMVNVLDYHVVDAKFSAALSSIVIASDTPSNALHVYDVATRADFAIALPEAPVAVAIDSTGLLAAVAYDAHVSWVDLKAGAVTTTCPVSSDAYDVALSTSGVAYVMPATDQWVSIHEITLSSCTETLLSNGFVYAGGRVALHPSGQALFADQDLDPNSVNECNLTAAGATCEDAMRGADWGTYAYGNGLWTSADGERLYTAGGATLSVPADVTGSPCTYGGSLDGVSVVQHLSEAPQAQRVALIPGNLYGEESNADTVVRVHETQYLGFVAQYELPAFPLAGTATAIAHGKFVFTTPTMGTLYAIVQADPSSGALNDFAIETIVP